MYRLRTYRVWEIEKKEIISCCNYLEVSPKVLLFHMYMKFLERIITGLELAVANMLFIFIVL